MHRGAARYQKASQATLSARDTEQAAFAHVTRGLETANDAAARARALGRNHDLWSALVKDLALDTNRLPDALKANLLSLGFWSMRYSTLAILRDLPLQPLIDVNRDIAEGLAAQTAAAPATNMKLSGMPA